MINNFFKKLAGKPKKPVNYVGIHISDIGIELVYGKHFICIELLPISELEHISDYLVELLAASLKHFSFISGVEPHLTWHKTYIIENFSSPAECYQYVLHMLNKNIPLAISEINFDFTVQKLKNTPTSPALLQIVAIKKIHINALLQAMSNFNISIIEPQSYALLRAFSYTLQSKIESGTLYIYQNSSYTLLLQSLPTEFIQLQVDKELSLTEILTNVSKKQGEKITRCVLYTINNYFSQEIASKNSASNNPLFAHLTFKQLPSEQYPCFIALGYYLRHANYDCSFDRTLVKDQVKKLARNNAQNESQDKNNDE